MLEKLDDRKRAILSAVIEDFIYSAEPVGSKRLVEKYGWSISSATVRNELALLEELGFLSHPHTSAGRVPTDRGYRFYVDNLSPADMAASTEMAEVARLSGRLTQEISELMRETSQFLSRLTSTLAIVYAPDLRREKIKHIDLIGLGSKNIMIVVILSNGAVSKQVAMVDTDLSDESLSKLESRVNEALIGMSVDRAWSVEVERRELSAPELDALDRIATSVFDSLHVSTSDRLYYDGATHLLDYPEMAASAEIRRVLAIVEHNYDLLEWLQAASKSGELTVSIGAENELELAGYTVIASGYEVQGESVGVLGILGPTRMDYRRSIFAVERIADQLGKALDELER